MAISKIGSDALAAGAPSRSQLPAGTVLQVVQGVFTGATTTTSSSYTATNVTASITPTSATSKILVFGEVFVYGSLSKTQPTITLYKNGVVEGVLAGWGFGNIYIDAGGYMESVLPFNLLSSPASTSSQTYTIYGANKTGTGTAAFGDNLRSSIITLMEIAA